MSIDYALFKPSPVHKPSRGLAYLLLAGQIDCTELERIDVDKIRAVINITFTGLFDAFQEEHNFQCELSTQGILLETYSSTPNSVVLWFQKFADTQGMVFFDPQSEKVTQKDKAECERRMLDAEKDDEQFRSSQLHSQLRKRAEDGDAHALFLLGSQYSFGEGVSIDKVKAFECFEASAKAGDADGMFNLAACFRFGDGIPKDIAKAIEWYERSARLEKIFAPYALGEIYMNGEGVPVDTEKAIRWFFIARENGNQDAGKPLRALGALPPLEIEMKRMGFRK